MADPVLPIYGKTINPRSSAGLKSIIYPNPVNALLNIDADKAVLKISIHNSSGTLVNELQSTSAISNVDVSELAIGLYIMTLTDEKGERYLEKIIIQ